MARISVNKLAELLVTANPARRRRIVYDQKYPNPAVVPRYRAAMPPIVEYLTSGQDDTAVVDRAVTALRNERGGTDWAFEDRQNTADALEHFLQVIPEIRSDGYEFVAAPQQPPRLEIAGTSVSIRPDLLIHRTYRGRTWVGAVKFHFIRNEDSALQRRGAEYVGTLLHAWLQQHGPGAGAPKAGMCLSVDVFRRSVVGCPSSVTRRMDEITAACEEVALRWTSL